MIKIPLLRMSFYGNGRFAFNVHTCTSIKNATAPTKGKVAFFVVFNYSDPSYIYVYKRKQIDEYVYGIEKIINELL